MKKRLFGPLAYIFCTDYKGPSTLAFFASVMAPLPNSFLCFFTYVIAREKQRSQLGGGTIADGETDAKNARRRPLNRPLWDHK
jgi:hypothetical protein